MAVAPKSISFADQGFAVVPCVLSPRERKFARVLTNELIARHRLADQTVLSAGVNVASVTERHPERNPGIHASHWAHELFIIGDLIALDSRFGVLLSAQAIWRCVAERLGCSLDDVVFHLSNVTHKPAGVGPAIGWHRDATNTYFAAADRRTVRVLLPLQPMSETNGGTAVLPGSHIWPLHADTPDIATAVYPLVDPGGCLVLHAEVLHGGAPNRSQMDRDVIVVQFGVRTSELLCKADEVMSLYSWGEFMKFSRQG
jgi:hypothetical protein